MNSKDKGNVTESRFVFEFVKLGYNVLLPFGDNCRYDMVIEQGNNFYRIQCKTGQYKNGCVRFNTCSSQTHRGKGKQSYRGQIDYFAIYCIELDKCYICHVNNVNIHEGVFRVEPTKNHQNKRVRWAKDFELLETFTPSTTVVQGAVNTEVLGSNPRG